MARLILILFISLAAVGCVSQARYTDLAIEQAVAEARIQAAEQAAAADDRRLQQIREAIRLWIEEQGFSDGRRPHRPGGA